MKCARCGAENRPQAEYCAWCGAEIEAGLPQEAASTPTEDNASASLDTPASGVEPAAAIVEPAGPLQVGDVLAGRYRILEVLSSNSAHNRYRTLDLAYCTICGYENNEEADPFCRKCGAALPDQRRTIRLEENPDVPPAAFDVHFKLGQVDYYGIVEPAASLAEGQTDDTSSSSPLCWGIATDQGRQRDHNEDYVEGWIYSRPPQPVWALFIVADGLGGQDLGEVASQMTSDIIWQQVKTRMEGVNIGNMPDVSQLQEILKAAVSAANAQLYRARIERNSQMSSTVTAALVCGSSALIANVGDSRAYIFGSQGLKRITKDHSLVQLLVDAGQITPDEVYTHPRRNLIYQSIGSRPDVQVDLYAHELHADERLLLCSDGLWEMVHDDGLEEVLMAESVPQQACDRLVRNANLAGGEDNISVIIVQVQ